jgi:hypothetical protein
VQEALASLPCVEPGSVKVDVTVQQARFTVKDKSKCSMQEVTKAIDDVGFTVAGVKLTP